MSKAKGPLLLAAGFLALLLSKKKRKKPGSEEGYVDPGYDDLPPDADDASDDDSILDDLTEHEIHEGACVLWLGLSDYSETDSHLALRLLQGMYPTMTWPGPPSSRRESVLAAVAEHFSKIRAGLEICDSDIVIDPTPRPNSYYQLKSGENLLGLIQKAYPGRTSGERVQIAKAMIAHPRNGGGVAGSGICVPVGECSKNPDVVAYNLKILGPVIIDFCATRLCGPKTESQRFMSGKCFAVVFFPPA